MEESAKPRRAIGIVRVSNVGDRDDDFGSPRTQEQRIRDACQARGLELIAVHEELNVSGGKPLDKRPGLRAAVEAIEAGEGEVIVAGYFDRLVRSLRVQEEVVGRVERAGGSVLAVDFGNVSNGTAAEWLSASMIGMMSEYYRRSMGERTQEAKARAVAAGIPPWPGANPGYVRDERKRFVPDPKLAPVVAEAFAMRDAGRSVEEVRVFLAEHGVERTYGGVQVMLRSRVYIGEIHVRGLAPNLSAHEPIVEREVFERVQRMRSTRGRRAKSERLLARQGVLRCATCGRRMVIGSSTRSRGPLYSCPRSSRCGRRAAISADKVEADRKSVV